MDSYYHWCAHIQMDLKIFTQKTLCQVTFFFSLRFCDPIVKCTTNGTDADVYGIEAYWNRSHCTCLHFWLCYHIYIVFILSECSLIQAKLAVDTKKKCAERYHYCPSQLDVLGVKCTLSLRPFRETEGTEKNTRFKWGFAWLILFLV